MTPPCPNCAALQDEVDYLRLIVAEHRAAHETLSLFHLGLTPQEAAIIQYLGSLRGRFASCGDIADKVGSKSNDPRQLIAVRMNRLRRVFGPDAIENVWAYGYRLTPIGQAKLHEALA